MTPAQVAALAPPREDDTSGAAAGLHQRGTPEDLAMLAGLAQSYGG